MPTLANTRYLCILLVSFWLLLPEVGHSRIERLRASWHDDPATSMVIGWDQVVGGRPMLYYDTQDHGTDATAYAKQSSPTRAARYKAMNNVFVRLEGLQPNTVYYFIVKDTEGVSKRYSFRTAPNDPNARLSIIAGSDSRNHRAARCDANRLVSKLRPHCVLFGGDMTNSDSDQQWVEWMDDWQLTIGSDGRLFPIVVARGNHESNNDVLVNCFDVPSPEVYYALTLGGNLLRIYTLNTLTATGDQQRDWLGRDLQANQGLTWRMAQYHQAMRPHNGEKHERAELIPQWATLFHKYKLKLVVESDAHVVKTTWPIRPSKEEGSHEGFIRDDVEGTIYVGEGGWGAPLRANNDPKPWTRSHGRFNQFKWIFVDSDKIEVRTVRTEGSNRVAEVTDGNPFEVPYGLVLWSPPEGEVVRIMNPNARPPAAVQVPPAQVGTTPAPSVPTSATVVRRDATGNVDVDYTLTELSDVEILLIGSDMKELARLNYPGQPANNYTKSLNLAKAPPGRYNLVVKSNGQLNQRYVLVID